MNNELIEDVLKRGRTLADFLRKVNSVEEFEQKEADFDQFMDFVDENFGAENEFGDKSSDLSTNLSVAFNWKYDALKDPENSETQKMFEGFLEEFEKQLESRDWR